MEGNRTYWTTIANENVAKVIKGCSAEGNFAVSINNALASKQFSRKWCPCVGCKEENAARRLN